MTLWKFVHTSTKYKLDNNNDLPPQFDNGNNNYYYNDEQPSSEDTHTTSTNSTNSNDADNHTNAGRTTRAEVMTGARARDRRVSRPSRLEPLVHFFSFSLCTMLNIIHKFSNYGLKTHPRLKPRYFVFTHTNMATMTWPCHHTKPPAQSRRG